MSPLPRAARASPGCIERAYLPCPSRLASVHTLSLSLSNNRFFEVIGNAQHLMLGAHRPVLSLKTVEALISFLSFISCLCPDFCGLNTYQRHIKGPTN